MKGSKDINDCLAHLERREDVDHKGQKESKENEYDLI